MRYPPVDTAKKLSIGQTRLFVGAYGFEERSMGWLWIQIENEPVLAGALMIRYENPKGKNKIIELKKCLNRLGVSKPQEISYDIFSPYNIEVLVEKKLNSLLPKYKEVILDISAMTKFLILICLYKLKDFKGTVRIVYTEAKKYAPTKQAYVNSKKKMEEFAKFPSRGFETILRAKCLSSIRMQGQPVTLVAFASFNEQLIRHMLGTINPHRLLFINGKPPKSSYKWRERAAQEIHSKLIDEYPIGNDVQADGLLKRVSSTLIYSETVAEIDDIYERYGLFERIIIAATGSKMQTVGLFFSKIKHPDIHIEYPTPDSYFVTGMSTGIEHVHEILIPQFANFIDLF